MAFTNEVPIKNLIDNGPNTTVFRTTQAFDGPYTAKLLPNFEAFPNFSIKQNEFIEAFVSQQFKFMLYGGAVGGGKTFLGIGLLIHICNTYENVRFAIVRKSLSVIKQNTVPSFYKVMEAYGLKEGKDFTLKKTEWYAVIHKTGSRIDFIDADISKDPQSNKLKGLELTGAMVEEANEVAQSAVDVLKTRIGRWRNKEAGIRSFIIFTCNPDTNWVKSVFYDPWKNGTLPSNHYYLPALPKDNPWLDDDYWENLDSLNPAERARYVEGDWDYIVNKNQLIQTTWMDRVSTCDPEWLRRQEPLFVGIDFAREGDDGTVLSVWNLTHKLWSERIDNNETGPVADRLEELLEEFPTIEEQHIACDEIGNGSALIDVMKERGYFIGGFKSSETALRVLKFFTFKNRRMEAYFLYKEAVRKQEFGMARNETLIRQTQVAEYVVDEKCMRMIKKDEMKKQLGGKSPDELDADVIGNYVRVEFIRTGDVVTSYANRKKVREAKKTLGRKKYHSTLVKKMVY